MAEFKEKFEEKTAKKTFNYDSKRKKHVAAKPKEGYIAKVL